MHPSLTFVTVACLVVVVLLLFSAFQGASYYGVTPEAQLAIAIITLVLIVIIIWIIYTAAKAKMYKIKTGKEALIGSVGIAVTDLNPKGEVRVFGEFWQATAQEQSIKKDEKVEVVDMEGMFLVVRSVKEKFNSLN
jgi:membrane-bound serine protease (ClpP class)